MRTILHVGTHKTGTTTIQKFSRANAKKLRHKGLWYPNYDLVGCTGHYAHHDFSHAVAGQTTRRMTPDKAKDFVAEIAKRGTDDQTVLISAEAIYRHILHKDESSITPETYWSDREAYVARLAETTAALDPEILIVLRRQDDFARSLFQENVKSTRYSGSYTTFLKERFYYFEYLKQIELFRRHFRKVNVLVFEDLIAEKKLVRDFYRALGVQIGRMSWDAEKNESLPMELIDYKRLLNGSSLSRDHLQGIANILIDMASDQKAHPLDRDLDWIPAEDTAAFFAGYEADNAAIFEMLETKHGRGTLFPPARPRRKVYAGIDLARFNAINAAVLTRALPKALWP